MPKIKKPKKKIISTLATNINDTFYLAFIGEYIELVLKDHETRIGDSIIPLHVGGFLLDMDDEHLYLSDDGQSIVRAVKRNDYSVIESANKKTRNDEMLEELNIPNDPDDGN